MLSRSTYTFSISRTVDTSVGTRLNVVLWSFPKEIGEHIALGYRAASMAGLSTVSGDKDADLEDFCELWNMDPLAYTSIYVPEWCKCIALVSVLSYFSCASSMRVKKDDW